ncbi:type IV pilus assembly protein PilM [Spirillospora sp. CA-253888]
MASTSLIGLDIGSTGVRVAQIRRGKNGPELVCWDRCPLPPGAVHGGVVHDDRAVTQVVKDLRSVSRPRGEAAALAVTSPQVVVRETTVAAVPAREMRASLPLQVRDALPLPVEESVLDFHPLGPPEGGRVRGLLVAAPKDAVITAVHAVERAGLRVARVDLGAFALLRATASLDGQVEAIVDLGARTTGVVVHRDGVPLIVRTLPRGGAEVTETIARRLDLPDAEAETLKSLVGLHADDPQTVQAVQEAVRPVVREILSSFAYLTSGGRSDQVARLRLTGGGALLPGLVEALGAQAGVPARLADPLMRVGGDADADLPGAGPEATDGSGRLRVSASIAIGLTLGETG